MPTLKAALTTAQTAAVKAFLAARETTRASVVSLAEKYKACLDIGVDMRQYGIAPNSTLHFRLTSIAAGKLLPEVHERLLGNHAMVKAMTTLPIDKQRELLAKGVRVMRGGRAHALPIEEVSKDEASRLLVAKSGRITVAAPSEQAARSHRARQRAVQFYLDLDEYHELTRKALDARMSIPECLLAHLRETGFIGGKRKGGGRYAETRLHA